MELSTDRGRAIIRGSVLGDRGRLTAQVLGGGGRTLQVLRDGRVIESVPVRGEAFTHETRVSGRGDYRLQVLRGPAVDALTTPITLGRAPDPEPALVRPGGRPASGGPGGDRGRPARVRRLRVSLSARRVRAGRRVRLRVRVTLGARPVRGALLRLAGARARTHAEPRQRTSLRHAPGHDWATFAGVRGSRRGRPGRPSR